ncbi:MAG: nitroreductase, partial [Spirochaetaceae bacterium]|nr:nitroreductase [Spirochaetaceae bacterium]
KELAEIMEIPDGHTVALVLALGTPVEHVVLEEIDSDASVKYYREPDGTHHVPKRKLDDLILKSFG